jgi:hypothetical protein
MRPFHLRGFFMKVFISWSGDRSQKVAFALREWIPSVINDVDPWVSDEDIKTGAHWPTQLGRELQEAKFGIICLTPENLNAPWILFEAGALSKVIDQARVTPYLFDVEKLQIEPPLGHFQASKAQKEDTRKLLHSINGIIEELKVAFFPNPGSMQLLKSGGLTWSANLMLSRRAQNRRPANVQQQR